MIPKELREALCLNGGDEVEITLADERIELMPVPRPARLRRGPHGLLTSDLKVPEYGPEEVREALERTRQWPR